MVVAHTIQVATTRKHVRSAAAWAFVSYADSPAGLAAWMLDHDTDSYEKISRAFTGGHPTGGLTRDRILDNITLYWLTNTATPAARMYWEGARSTAAAAGQPPPPVSLPVAFTVFPGEIFQGAAQLGREGLPQPHLLPRGRPGRPDPDTRAYSGGVRRDDDPEE
jgi:hypothetical protein